MNKAILVLMFKDSGDVDANHVIEELKSLAEAAGAEVMGVVTQNKDKVEAATYIGSGKAEQVRDMVLENECDLAIFNDELSGSQIRNLEEIIGARIVDRTLLILDIFADRAKTNIARLQVDLARQKYKLPRLVGFGGQLSRTGAGGGSGGVRVGTRGAGEQKLELDRRAIQKRITELERQISEAEESREIQRSKREKNEIPIVALVGYTNAGKSSVMNYFIEKYTAHDEADKKKVFEKDMLFATLDTYSRHIVFEDKSQMILVDTVGFVSKLPHGLVKAFKSTLEEAALADLLVQVVDVANVDSKFQKEVTLDVIHTIGAGEIPMITALNKADLLADRDLYVAEDELMISAKTGEGMDTLSKKIRAHLFGERIQATLLIPFGEGAVQNYLQNKYAADLEWTEKGAMIRTALDRADYERYRDFIWDS
ncbi:MAG: GTPase HflX [Bacillota bacterium]|nr:GTPase HflX [Bacillota bacterium]